MVKQKKESTILKKTSFILLIGVVLIGFYFFTMFFQQEKKNTFIKSTQGTSKKITIENDILNFSVFLPSVYTFEEHLDSVTFNKGSQQIRMYRNCTDFEKIEDHLSNLDKINNSKFTGKHELISGYKNQIVLRTTQDTKTYFILPKNECIYIFSASSPNLYPDLDQIAKSFEYLGDE